MANGIRQMGVLERQWTNQLRGLDEQMASSTVPELLGTKNVKEEVSAALEQAADGSSSVDCRQWPFESSVEVPNPLIANPDVLQGVIFGCNSTNQSQRLKIEKLLEHASSVMSQKAVDDILDDIEKLSDKEKLMLYYKLPLRRSSDVDPLRMPLNPLGSRPEIQQTIVWIQTHLEEDADTSLPKHEVYEEYMCYCSDNNVKPLSTADFGKVMKQVFPTVRPRRLGTRGHSRYCYSGLRKKIELERPALPDLNCDSTATSEEGASRVPEGVVEETAGLLVKEWAEKLLGIQASKMADIANYLVEKLYVDQRSKSVVAWNKLQNHGEELMGISDPETLKKSPDMVSEKEKEQMRELKRKLQEHQTITSRRYTVQNRQSKKTKVSGVPPVDSQESDDKEPKTKPRARKTKAKTGTGTLTLEAQIAGEPQNLGEPNETVRVEPETESKSAASKVAIPRLHSSPRSSGTSTVILLPGLNQANGSACSSKQKYVPIQPKPSPSVSPHEEVLETVVHAEATVKEQWDGKQTDDEVANFWNVSGDSSSPKSSTELSQLRVILEQNLTQPKVCEDKIAASSAEGVKKVKSLLERRNVRFETPVTNLSDVNNHPAAQGSVIPPSPNTRRRAFNFTPISPRKTPVETPVPEVPQSPGVASTQLRHLLSSQTSPFVSPRQTPVPSRHNSGTQVLDTPVSMVSDSFGSVASTSSDSAFVSPLNTPLSVSRSRHNSASSMLVNRARHSSGASVSLRHVPYITPQGLGGENPLLSATRSRHSSAGSPALPRSAPLSPLVTPLPMGGADGVGKRVNPDPRRRHVSAGNVLNRAGYYGVSRAAVSLNAALPVWGSDPLAPEIEGLLDSAGGLSGASLMRSQSVPLQQMLQLHSGHVGSDSAAYPTVYGLGSSFACNASTASSPYSFAETPIPNEWTDFGSSDPSMANVTDQLNDLDAEGLHDIISKVYANNKEELAPCLEELNAEALSVSHALVNGVGSAGNMDSVNVQSGSNAPANPLMGEPDPLSCSDTGDGFPVSDLGDSGVLYEAEEFAAALVALRETPDLCRIVQEVEGSVAVSQSLG